MKKVLIIVFLYLFFQLSAFAQVHINIADFGSVPYDGKNTVIAVREALKACSDKDSSVLVFPKGRYDFWPNFTIDQATIGLELENMKNLTIDGSGSEFIFHGKMQVAKLEGCTNVVLQNFSVDWEHPFIAQCQYILATDEYIDVKIDPQVYVIENGLFYLIGEGWKSRPTGYFTLFDKDKKEVLYKTRDGLNKEVFLGRAEELEPGIVRFYGKPQIKPEAGTYQVLYAGTYIATGIQITESKDVYLKDIKIYHALSNGVLGFRTENITMDNVNMAVNEIKGRVFSTVADGSHFRNCKGLIKIINCKHTGLGDDFVNVRGVNSLITKVENKYTVITGGKYSEVGKAGDEVWFINQKTFQRGEVRIIKAIERVASPEAKGRRSASRITFTQSIPESSQVGDIIENKTWNPRVEIRNCEILKKNRARGILVTTPEKVVIENNYFRTAGTAILIEGDVNYWFESGAMKDVTIRNNIFEDCLSSGGATGKSSEWGEAIISITPSHHPQNEKTEPYHKNIKIENNIFKTFDVPLVHARSVRGLYFNNNEIIKTYTYKPFAWQKASFLLDGCREVIISNNKIDKNYSTRLVEIEHMKKTDVKVDENSKFSIQYFDNLP